MIVLDTNVLSELVRARPAPAVVSWLDAQPGNRLATTAVTVAELRFGVARLPQGARRAALTLAVDGLVAEDMVGRVLAFDASAAVEYADIAAGREAAGRPVATADGQIAAICRARGAVLATRNVRDFEGTGVDLVNPFDGDTVGGAAPAGAGGPADLP